MVELLKNIAAFSLAILVGLLNLSPTPVAGCPYSIRDSAFIGADSLPSYQLLLITGSTDESIRDSIDTATTAWLSDANVVAEIVPPDSATVRALSDRLPIEDFPTNGLTAVLVSPQGGTRLLGSMEADQISLDSVMRMVALAVDSPLRTRLREELVHAWCVLMVVSHGDSEAATRRVADDAHRAGERIVGTSTELDKIVQQPPVVVVLDEDDSKEQTLLWSLGLADENSDPTAVRLVMLTGRGEVRGPVLVGEDATEEAIHGLLKMLGRSCTCTTDNCWLSGPVIPLEWGDEMREAVQEELGFDPEDSEAVGAITGVTVGLEGALGFQGAAFEYQESSADAGIADHTPDLEKIATGGGEPTASASRETTSNPGQSPELQPSTNPTEHQAPPSPGLSSMNYLYRVGGTVFVGGIALLVVASMFMLRNTTRS